MGGCDLSQSETRESSPLSQGQLPSLNNINYTDESLVTGRKLTEVAGRASLPVLQMSRMKKYAVQIYSMQDVTIRRFPVRMLL